MVYYSKQHKSHHVPHELGVLADALSVQACDNSSTSCGPFETCSHDILQSHGCWSPIVAVTVWVLRIYSHSS